MRIEVRTGKVSPIMVVIFEKDTNYDPDKNEWTPRLSEVALIYEAIKLIAQKEEIDLYT